MYTIPVLSSLRLCMKIISSRNTQQIRHYRHEYYKYLKEIKERKDLAPPPPPTPRSEFLEWNYKSELYAFGKRLNEEFDETLLRQALTQKSFLVKQEEEQKKVGIENLADEGSHNTEMAYYGEEIMNNFITLFLRIALPRLPEEGIQSIKNYLMKEETLSRISADIGTADLILTSEYPVESPTLSNVFKALVFALKESSGLERATLFIRDFLITQLAEEDINDFWVIEDPISVLKQICRNENCGEPEPRIVGEAGVSTVLALYRVGLYINKQMIGLGPGESVKTAHEMAACDVLRRLFGTSEHQLRIPFRLVIDPMTKSKPNVSVHDWCEKKLSGHMIKPDKKVEAS